jgi:hypothetical protein
MTDSDDQRRDPSDYATVDEVRIGLARLSPLELQAGILVRATTMNPGDLINTVMERLLTRDGEHGRHWHKKETLADCIYRTMKATLVAILPPDIQAGLISFECRET